MAPAVLDAAMQYHERGFNVLPLRPDKKPFFSWERLQKQRADKAEVEKWFRGKPDAMVGIVTGSISGGLAVVDCDTEAGEAAFFGILPDDQPRMPWEKTPRGGKHFFFKTDAPLGNAAGFMPGVDFRGNGGYIVCAPSVNAAGKAYTWGSSASLLDIDPPALPDAIASALKGASNVLGNSINTLLRKSDDKSDDNAPRMFTEGRRDDDLFHTANFLVKGGMPEREIIQVLENLIVSWGEKPDQKWIADKTKSAFKRLDSRERTLSQDVREWVLSSSGLFLSSDVVKSLHVSSREEAKNISKILGRLRDEKVIERTGNKNGQFRRIENDCEIIDFINTPSDVVNIRYPLGIDQYVKTLPKNIIVVAGESNSGKTAFLLRLAAMNQHKHEIHYFSSEMGPLELRERLGKFEMPLTDWRVKFKERAGNFADVIQPDAINIIDFLELHEDFFKAGLYIKEIFDKLNKGIAIIALQKNKGKDHGLGGERSIEKARLYLAMEPGKIKIVKAKNWAQPEHNPNGLEINFKLAAGCKFINDTPWHKAA